MGNIGAAKILLAALTAVLLAGWSTAPSDSVASRAAKEFSAIRKPQATTGAAGSQRPGASTALAARGAQLQAYGSLPLIFEPNRGQTDARVRFLARGPGYALFLTSTEAVLRLLHPQAGRARAGGELDVRPARQLIDAAVLRIKFVGANHRARVTAAWALPGKANYFVGNDPKRWRVGIPTYAQVRYQDLYPGIDLLFYGRQQQLEYDFVVAPGAHPRAITMAFDGTGSIEVDGEGDLILHTATGRVRQHRPRAYQEINGIRRAVPARYVLHGNPHDRRVTFALAAYDPRRPLVIDPVLSYSTYLGGGGADSGNGIAVDGAGSAYISGATASTNFPTVNPLQPGLGGQTDAFVAKLNAAGSALVYATYLGGSVGDIAHGIAVDAAGSAVVTGTTLSSNFPTLQAFQTASGGVDDGFVTKLSANGSALVFSSYLGGNGTDIGKRVALDGSGNAYITGYAGSSNFPTTAGAFQQSLAGPSDAFVAKVSSTGARVYVTLLGGFSSEYGHGIVVDASGNAYLTGQTNSTGFPTTRGAFQTTCNGCQSFRYDVFVTKFNAAGSALMYSTYLGGSIDDFGFGIAVDASGNAYVTGLAESSNFDTTPGAFDTTGTFDAFITKVNAMGTGLVYSTYLGPGSGPRSQGLDIALDTAGNAYVTGATRNTAFPLVNPLQAAHGGAGADDAFVSQLNAAGTVLLFSTYLGGLSTDEGRGIRVDASGNIYVTGQTFSTNFPTANSLQATNGGSSDAFVARIAVSAAASCAGLGSFNIRGGVRTSARVPVAGVTMTLAGPNGCTNTTTTTAQGVYQFATLANGSYAVTPSKAGCTFTPSSQMVTIAGANVGANFTASCN